ncbi:MAG: hypothetical protein II333_03585, partial [Clostridia bacterium]|nr:hypothetical protein [Clostridia bacterium]
AHADWHEKYKMLKMAWPMKVENPKAYYEIPFGVIERPADGEEEPGLMWTAVRGDNAGYAIVNDNTYSSSVKDGTIYQTILRSPIYGDHGGPRTEESEFTDQGRINFKYTLMPTGDEWTNVTREAKLLNKPFTNIIENWHEGKLSVQPYAGISIDCDNVMLSALKRSEDGTGTIVRLYEIAGKEADVTVTGDVIPAVLKGYDHTVVRGNVLSRRRRNGMEESSADGIRYLKEDIQKGDPPGSPFPYAILFHPVNPVFLAFTRFRIVAVDVAEDAVADALVIAFDAEVGKDLLPFRTVEFFLRAVDPAASDAEFVRGEHQIAHDEAAVIEMRAAGFVGEDDEHHRRAVERIVRCAHRRGVQRGQAVADFPVGDREDDRGL